MINHRRIITADVAREAAGNLDDDIRIGRLALVDTMWRRTLDLAATLSTQYSPRLGARTLDVLHVATAKVLAMTHFVSYDARQMALAKAIGLRAVKP